MGRGARRRFARGAAVAGTAALLASFVGVRSGRAAALDERAAGATSRPLGVRADRVIAAATDVGSVYGVAGLGGLLLLTGHRRLAVDVTASGLLAWGAAQAAKPLLPRERPYQVDGAARLVAVPAGTSWPSGHGAVATAMAVTLAPELRPAARAVLAAAVVGVGASRLYVGVHHLSDVVAGTGVGALAAVGWLAVRRG